MKKEFNVVIGAYAEGDKELFFNGLTHKAPNDSFKYFYEDIKYNQLFKELGIFESVSEGTRNGWNKDIPYGWSDLVVGKQKNVICVLKQNRADIEELFKMVPEYGKKKGWRGLWGLRKRKIVEVVTGISSGGTDSY